jgi:dephospho-CoA kinase
MKIAVTGGIAEGKSTVLRILAEEGYATASSDEFARECFVLPEVQQSLADLVGTAPPVPPAALLHAIGESDRVRRAINRIFHPHVLARIEETTADFVEVPLLLEACLQQNFDAVWVVTCGPEVQRERLVLRGGTTPPEALIATQLPTLVKLPFADVILRTNVDLEAVKRTVLEAAQTVSPKSIARFKG